MLKSRSMTMITGSLIETSMSNFTTRKTLLILSKVKTAPPVLLLLMMTSLDTLASTTVQRPAFLKLLLMMRKLRSSWSGKTVPMVKSPLSGEPKT